MRDEFLQANLRAITHLPDMVKLSLVSRHIFCLFILTREVFSCHYPATFLRVQFFEEELKVHDSDMNLLALLPEIPHFKSLVGEEPFCTEMKTFGF